jgi:stress-induced morphogen
VRFQQLVHAHHVIFVGLKTEFRGVHALSLYMQVVLEA